MFRTLSFVLVAAAAVACTKPDAPPPPSSTSPSAPPVATTAPAPAVSAATSAAHEEIAAVVGDAGCGSKESPCPLQAWMKENANPPMSKPDLPALAEALEKMVAFAPPGGGFPNWSSIAKDGAAAARNGDKEAAKASCRSCHDQYKKKYQAELRGRKDLMRQASSKTSYRAKTPKLGRPIGRFTQHRRIDRLREALESEPKGLTLEELAAYLRITERSVRRYLRELDGTKVDEKFELLEPVATRPGGPLRWRIKPGERGRAVSLRRAQAYALLATRQGFDVLRGSALYDEVDLALGQIAKIAQTPFRTGRTEISGEHKLESRFVFAPSLTRSYASRGDDLDELFRAVADLRVIHYRPRSQRSDRQAFRPYAMVMHHGAIYVVGAPAAGGEVEAVPLEAMTDIRSSETDRFALPSGFDVSQYVHGELGVGRLGKARFTVDFDARVADEVKSKRIHALQRTASSPDGRVRLSLPLVDMSAATTFVLSWGDAARVVDPPELVADVRSILSRAAARYS